MEQENKQPKSIKAIVCQLDCVFMQKTENIKRFDDAHLSHLTCEDKIDIILFPELAWTGYNIQNKDKAKTLAVQYGKGEEFQYAKILAQRTKAYVMFGYIQSVTEGQDTVLYDSAAIVDRSGKPLTNTRKTHLLPFDKQWGVQWDSFNSIQLINWDGQAIKCGLPICYDIQTRSDNPIDYKFGEYAKENDCELILFMTCWFDNKVQCSDSGTKIQQHWIERLKPLIQPSRTSNVLFLGSNKAGKEFSYYLNKQIQFVGSSCAISINPQITLKSLEKAGEEAFELTYTFKQ